MSLIPLVILDVDPEIRKEQLAKLAGKPTLGLNLTDPVAIAACTLEDIRYSNSLSATERAASWQGKVERGMRLIAEEATLDVLTAAAIFSMRKDGVGMFQGMPSFNNEVRERIYDLSGGKPWLPTDDCDTVSVAHAVRQRVEAGILSVSDLLCCIRSFLETGTFVDVDDIQYHMRNDRYGIRVLFRDATSVAGGRIAIISSPDRRLALAAVQFRADVAVWVNPAVPRIGTDAHARQVTIWQKEPGLVNFAGVLAELSTLEGGWTGTVTEGRSAENFVSQLDVLVVVRMLLKYHRDGARAARQYLEEAVSDSEFTAAVKDGSSTRGSDLLARTQLLLDLS